MARWLLANVVGWALGYFLGGLFLHWVGTFSGVHLAGAVDGVVVGAAQSAVLRSGRHWVLVSGLGGGLAVLPAYLSGIALLAGPGVGYFIVGAVYGSMFGMAQWFALHHAQRGWWVMLNGLAGGLCGCLTLGFNPLGLPVLCSPGPVIFGLLTGYALLKLDEKGAGSHDPTP